MKIGVYVDAYNLYYGGRRCCGRGKAGWRWLNIRALAKTLVAERAHWAGSTVDRVIYCTARIDARLNPGGQRDQDVYLKALLASGAVDRIEYGNYVARLAYAPLATKDAKGRPVLTNPQWPVMVQSPPGTAACDSVFMVSCLRSEEKGSDVNVAAHLLMDVLEARVDAVVVVSNDTDLKLPASEAWRRVPVGVVNPGLGYSALRGSPEVGVGNHWWRTLKKADFERHQLLDPVGRYQKPSGW
jgi:hypothetical protein